jgi:glucose-1-phosphate adenylyltransferase
MVPNSGLASNTLTVVIASGAKRELDPLTRSRPKPLLPFGGTYRLIDFTLSNCINSGLRRVYVLTDGQPDVNAYVRRLNAEGVRAPELRSLLEQSTGDFVALLAGDLVYRMDYRELLEQHRQSCAEITVAATGVRIFNRRTLVEALHITQLRAEQDFYTAIIPALTARRIVSTSDFTPTGRRFSAYRRAVETLDDYFRANMEAVAFSLLDPYDSADWPMHGGTNGSVSPGFGGRVVESFVSANVQIDASSSVHSSVLLPNVQVGSGVRIERAIVGENVRIGDGVEIGRGGPISDKYGFVTKGGVVVIPPNTRVERALKVSVAGGRISTGFARDGKLPAGMRVGRG